jgi:hypothetical protein
LQLANPRIRAAFALLAFWVIATMLHGLLDAATAHGPAEGEVVSILSSVWIPGTLLPILILAGFGSRLAWILAAAFLTLDVLDNTGSAISLLVHIVLAGLAIQAAIVSGRKSHSTVTDDAETTEPPDSAGFDSSGQVSLWRRFNLGFVLAACFFAFVVMSVQAEHIVNDGTFPLLTAAISTVLLVAGWTAIVLVSARIWKEWPFLLWLFPPALFVGGYVLLTVMCLDCTWSHR